LELEEIIYKHALANAVKHEGRAQVGPVVSKVLAERPDLKAKVKEVVEMAKKVVERVNSMPLEDQMREIQRYPEVMEEKKKRKRRSSPLTER
jgi:glutamyl-tRNA synthetase (EC 6.1.1.17)